MLSPWRLELRPATQTAPHLGHTAPLSPTMLALPITIHPALKSPSHDQPIILLKNHRSRSIFLFCSSFPFSFPSFFFPFLFALGNKGTFFYWKQRTAAVSLVKHSCRYVLGQLRFPRSCRAFRQLRFGLFWFVLVCFGLFWFVLVCFGLFWFVLVRFGLFWFVLVVGLLLLVCCCWFVVVGCWLLVDG